jgi:hypothetical protein
MDQQRQQENQMNANNIYNSDDTKPEILEQGVDTVLWHG